MLKEGLSIDITFNPPSFLSDYTFKSAYSSKCKNEINK